MKKILGCVAILSTFAVFSCQSIDKAKVGGKEIVTATRFAPVILFGLGAPVTKCLDDLDNAGVKAVTNANGAPTGGLFSSSRISGSESCQASGER